MKEVWKDIPDLLNYQASNLGRIRSVEHYIKSNFKNCKQIKRKGRVLKQYKENYCSITINENGKIKKKLVHRLVASAFIPNPQNKPCINHKDGNKYNNNIDNLEWCTIQENTKHAYDKGLQNNKRDKKGRFIKNEKI